MPSFLREARSAAAITHPNVATVYQVGEAEGRVFIAMELVDGENLRERVARGRLDLATAKDLAAQIARGLAAAHEKGIVHRDLKPENVMITPSGLVKLLDFGLAKVGVERPESGKTAAALAKTETLVTSDEGRVMGTPEYMSPEQALGEALDVRSDVFSFGIVVYEMLSGTRPFGGTTTGAILVAIARDVPAPLRQKAPEVDEATEAVVMRCLAKAAAERFGSAREIVAALSGQSSPRATTVSATEVPPIARTDEGRRSASRRLAALASTAPEQDHFVPAATLVQAATEAGDMAGAARTATDYLARRRAWKDPLPYRTAFFIGAAARGGALSRAQADRQLDEIYQGLVKQEWPPEEAWAAVYAYAAETRAEAIAAVARLDAMDAAAPKGWRGATSRTFFLAGRSVEARPLAENNMHGCSSVLLVSRNVLHSHLYLGEIDEQSGDKPSACAHYARVLERWGHARPRSVTADEARAHATKLGCSPP